MTLPSTPRKIPVLCIACVLLALLGSGVAAQEGTPPAPDEVSEEIRVAEASVLVDFGAGFPRRRLQGLQPEDVRILEEGRARQVLRLEPVMATPQDRWELLIYFDTYLSSSTTVRRAAQALGDVATALTQLGEVRVVVADPSPRQILRSRSAVQVQDTLAQVAKEVFGEDRLSSARRSFARTSNPSLEDRRAALEREVALVGQQTDRLLRLLGDGCEASACALLLVSDGFEVATTRHFLGDLATDADRELGEQVRRSALELADSVSVLERVTVIPVLEERREIDTRPAGDPQSSFDTFLQRQGSYFDGIRIPLGRRSRRASTSSSPTAVTDGLGALIRPSYEPLRALAEESAGAFVRTKDRLVPTLQSLALRYRVWYQTTRGFDGQVSTLEARFANGRILRAPRWAEASTPYGVAAARARGALRGEGAPGELKVEAVRRGAQLAVTLRWADDAPTVTSGFAAPVRVTVAQEGENGQRVAHRTVTVAQPSASGDTVEIELADFGTQRLAVHAEDLRFRSWGRILVGEGDGGSP